VSSGGPPRRAAARAWCRVDLAGGTLDIWPLGLLHPGARTVNVAIDLPAGVTLTRRESGYSVRQGEIHLEAVDLAALAAEPEGVLAGTFLAELDAPPVDVELAAGSPRGGGLGGSSALGVALIAAAEALAGREPSPPAARVALARDLEARMMRLPTGVQDHWPALLGGVLEIGHGPGGTAVRRLPADLAALGESLLVAYTGQSHFSAGANWRIVRRRLDGDPETARRFAGIAEAAAEAAAALEAGDLPRLGAAVRREWEHRRELAPGISTPAIEAMLDAAAALGAWGGKACGAGGGGSIALLCPSERRAAIAGRLAELGGTVLDVRPTAEPLAVDVG